VSQEKDYQDAVDSQAESGQEKLPPAEFAGFIVSLAQAALMHLGELPDPTTGQPSRNVAHARYSIDVIDMLATKTKGNLTAEEETLLSRVLSDLKMKFVRTGH
jgi:hypothetical protein